MQVDIRFIRWCLLNAPENTRTQTRKTLGDSKAHDLFFVSVPVSFDFILVEKVHPP